MEALGDVSFLIGSGFSVPAGYPTTSKLNERLGKIAEHEICIHSSGDAWFLNGQQEPNAPWMGPEERYFVQEFLEFYQSTILGTSGSFHYEAFYDYYRQALQDNHCPDELVPFFRGFRVRHQSVIGSDGQLLWKFHHTFSQLIASLLRKKPEHSHLCKPYPPSYERFLLLAEALGKRNRVHVHSLNHDLWLERLAISDSIRGEMDDGFEELGSPYFGGLDRDDGHCLVRIARFTDIFTRRFRLYKLHGSVDRYWFRGDRVPDLIKVKWGVSHMHLYKEVRTNGKLEYVQSGGNYYPDFLTGTTHKIDTYGRGKYYPAILRRFKRNLVRSSALIVVGYGFRDLRINEYIEKKFLSGANKPVFVVGNKERPDWQHFKLKRVHFQDGGVSLMNIGSILDGLHRKPRGRSHSYS